MDDKQFEPLTHSPFEPNYYRHYRKLDDDRIKWDVEVQEPRRYVDGGICDTMKEADAAIEAAVEKDLKEIARSFGL